MALERMEKEVEERSRQRSQADILAERFDEERVEHREKVRCLEEETQQWRERYEALIDESASEKEAATRRVKYIENQLQQASKKESELLSYISELQGTLQGTLSEQNAMLQEYYDHIKEQENNMESLKSENASMRGHGGELKRANEEKKELKLKIEMDKKSLKEYADQCDSLLKDLEQKNAEVKEAQRQQAEYYRRLQLAEGEVAQLRMKLEAVNKRLEAVESEKAHMDVLKDLERRDAMVMEAQRQQAECYRRLQQAIESLKSEIESMRGQIKALNSELMKSLEEKKRLSVELAEASKMVAMLEQKNKEWEGRLDAQLSDNEKMSATMKDYEAECNSLLKDVETITEEAKAARLERDLAQKKVSNLMATLSSRNDEIDRLRAQLGLPQQQQPPPQRPVTLSAVGVAPKQDRDTVGGRLEGQREQPYGIPRALPPGGRQSEVVRGGGDGYIRGQTVPVMPYGGRGEMPPRGSMERGGEMPHMGSMERGGGEMPTRGQLGNMQRIASPMNLQPLLPPRMMGQQAGQMNQIGQLNQLGQLNRTALEQLKVCEGDLVMEREALEEEKKLKEYYENEWRRGEVEKEGSRKRIEELEANAVHSREEVSGELMSLRMELERLRKQSPDFYYHNVEILWDQKIGNGAYGAVCKAVCDDLQCAAKVLHPVLTSDRNVQNFHQECLFLSTAKHPNIIQYLGTRDEGPEKFVLLMELMKESLTSYLERSTHPLPLCTEVNLCHDISLALVYLHSNNLIHRDLSGNNILLGGDLRAKITDFGMSMLASPAMSRLTRAPGCTSYMSPEALADPPKYSNKLDIFSFGVLIVQILTRQFPDPGPAKKKVRVSDPKYPMAVEVPIPERERRKTHIDLIDPAHLLLKHALSCICDEEKDRPSAHQLCGYIMEVKNDKKYFDSASQKLESQLEAKQKEFVKIQRNLTDVEKLLKAKDHELSVASEQLRSAEQTILLLRQNLEVETTVKMHTGFTGDLGNGIVTRLEATQDVWLERGDVNYNSHEGRLVLVGNHFGYPKKRFLIQFENLPSKCKLVKCAKMYLFFFYAHKASFNTVRECPDIPRTLRVHQVKKEWSETQATSALRLPSVPWSAPYLSLDGRDADSKFQDEVTVYTGRPSGYIEFDITEAVRNWRKGDPNYGLLVVAKNELEVGRDLRFFSREHADQSKHPFVNVLCEY